MDHSSTGFLLLTVIVLILTVIALYRAAGLVRDLHDTPPASPRNEQRMDALLTEMQSAINEVKSAFAPRDHNP